jgi:ABC-type sugar transport system permease subunit
VEPTVLLTELLASTELTQKPLRRRWGDMRENTLAWWLLLPALLLLLLIVVYPIGRLIYNSFYDMRLADNAAGVAQFVGWRNYQDLADDPEFFRSLANTLGIVVITVPGALIMGLLLALLANVPVRYQGLMRLSLLLPWALPLSFVGLIFAWFFNYDHGVINDLLQRVGITPRFWLTRPWLANIAIWLTIIWKTSSFMALILLAGLQMIPRSLYEAAQVDGASRWQQFWHITLPMLLPSMLVALIFRTITAFQTFDVPFTMTHGGPGYNTQTLAMYIHKTTIDYLDVGYGSALAVAMFLLSMLVSVIYQYYVGKEE